MDKLKKLYSELLIALPILLVTTVSLVSYENIQLYTTNFEVAKKEQKTYPLTVEVYGEGFKIGDAVYVEGERQESVVVYDKLITFKLPKRYMSDRKIKIKIQRVGQSGMIKEASNSFVINNEVSKME